jgi:glycosyltransferase involved in cell wall biosynthesis
MRSGGGTRIKLLEAAAFGVPSIATPEAASGLYSAARPWGWIARGPLQFADACLEALTDAKQAATRAAVGRREVTRNFDRVKIVRQLAQRFKELIDEREKSSE